MATADEYVEIKVTPRGYHKLGVSRKVDAARAKASIIFGKDMTGVYPVFIQAAAGSDVRVPINNSLARGARVRATGLKNNTPLLALPFVAYFRPGALEAAKKHLNGDDSDLDFSATDWSVEAARRTKKWKEGGPWTPPDQLAHFCQPLPAISLNAISWGAKVPYDIIPAFRNLDMGDKFHDLVLQLRARMTFDYMTASQLTVYALWWCYYITKSEDDEQASTDTDDVADTVPLIIFTILIPTVLREAEEDGLAVWPNLMLAAVTRSAVDFSNDDQERLETETTAIQDQLMAIYTSNTPEVCAGLLPGDLIGTKNEAFADEQLRKSKWANPNSHQMSHYEAVQPMVDMLGDINTIYRPHPRSKSTSLEFRTLISAALYHSHWKIVRRYQTLPSLQALQNNKSDKHRYTHIALPSSMETRRDYSALANKPNQNIVTIPDYAGRELSYAGSVVGQRTSVTSRIEAVPQSLFKDVKEEPFSQTLVSGALGQKAGAGTGQAPGFRPPKRQCLPRSSLSSSYARIEPSTEVTPPSSTTPQNPAQNQAPAPTVEVGKQALGQWISNIATLPRTQGHPPTSDFIHIDQVLPEALKLGWAPPARICEAARARGLLDPSNEGDQARLALLGFERPKLRTAPVPLIFCKDDLHNQHLFEDVARGGHDICRELSHRPGEGVLAALRVVLHSFTPLTKKLAHTLQYITTDPTAASDIIALRCFEEGLCDLLGICNRIALLNSALADARLRHPSDPRHQISPSITNSLAEYLEAEFAENLPPEFYTRVASCRRWTLSTTLPSSNEQEDEGEEGDHHRTTGTTTTAVDFVRWTRDLHKFWYASAIVTERCCAAIKLGCHEMFLPATRARLWQEWTRPWEGSSADGPWCLYRKHEMSVRKQQQQQLQHAALAAAATVTGGSTPPPPPPPPPLTASSSSSLEPATCLTLDTLGYELHAELIATAISDMHGDQDIAAWLTLPCDVGRSVQIEASPAAMSTTQEDGLYLHKGRYWCL
ncbi:uncharacterized protein B0I36DRAFT_367630 [Microdochium trichocladiopsis]|uniref:Uncharacterized protein n=1 Tax=Microdochium trichocladiopsis TaxID=1682393 RepID=A0A9P8XW04_9PEZI|nr:uncharacterized protein B0I36DRAFT_367630 [Microdochium trichocladiopsis]KAH7021198.1 hypothetical protein B0I36DRAFT_367630 [Microdochium trichocladiopsis]